jgi:hypothetical protein
MRLSEKLKEKNKTVYQQVAEKYGVSVDYVGKVARSERLPTKKKGLEIKKELESLI